MLRETTDAAALDQIRKNYRRAPTFPPPLSQTYRHGTGSVGGGLYSSTPPTEDGGSSPPPTGDGGSSPPPPPESGPPAQAWDVLLTRPINFHLIEDTTSGASNSELRCYGPIANPFRIAYLNIYCPSGGSEGQLIDVLISTDNDPTDTATPTGTSIFSPVQNANSQPTPDGDTGLPVPATNWTLEKLFTVTQSGQSIKVRSYVKSPGLTRAPVHVTMIIEELTPAAIAPALPPPYTAPPTQPPAPTPPPTTQPPAPATTAPWTVRQDFRFPNAAYVYIEVSGDPAWHTGQEFAYQAGAGPRSFWTALSAGLVTWLSPPLTSAQVGLTPLPPGGTAAPTTPEQTP